MGRLRWVLVAAVAVAAFVAAFALASPDDDGGDARDAAPGLDTEGLPVEAQELVALADRGGQLPYHAVYEAGPDRFEVWVDGDRAREETIPGDGERRLVLRTGDEVVTCTGDGTEWTCDDPVPAEPGGGGPVDQLLADLAGAQVSVRDGEVGDRPVRCFDVAEDDEPVVVCLTTQGILARLEAGAERLELVDLDDDVDEDAFEVP